QLGDGTTTDSPLPVAVLAIEDAIAIAAGYNHNCAVRATGELACWGWNAAGQLGDGAMSDSAAPIAAPARGGATGRCPAPPRRAPCRRGRAWPPSRAAGFIPAPRPPTEWCRALDR